ncbi:MAG TPA: hypothetical protein VGB45_04695 [Abditibacterium sp.]|jgi:hypothetical protein
MIKSTYLAFLLGALLLGNAPVAHSQSSAIIRARYAAIERQLPQCRVVKRELSGYSAEGGELTAYSQRGEIKKLVARHYGEGGRSTEEFYFWKNQLFFVLITDWSYEFPLASAKTTGRETRTQLRFYFQNGKLTRWVNGNNLTPTPSPEALKKRDEVLGFARDYLGKIRQK